LRRNAATRGGRLDYRATTAQWHADRRAWRPKVAKLAAQRRVAAVRAGPARGHGHCGAWSPQQIANRLPIDFAHDESMRISHEAILWGSKSPSGALNWRFVSTLD
jgi:IS30 family transposase